MTVSEIINAFGGISAATRILKVKYPSVIQGWIARNKIPDWRIDDVNRAAKELGLTFRITLADKKNNP